MVVRFISDIQKMVARSTSEVDTSTLKLQIERKFGHERSSQYFNLLSRYFLHKINKSEFDQLFICVIGTENLRLHNLLIQAILKNTILERKVKVKVKVPNGCQSSLQELCRDTFPKSPQKARTKTTGVPKFKGPPIPLTPNPKASIVLCDDTASVPKIQDQQSASLGRKPPREVISIEDGEEVEQASGSPGIYSRSPIRAPFGITINKNEPPKVLRLCGSCISSGELPETLFLKNRLEQKLEIQGLGISRDFVSILNSSIDVYLKRLIVPCMQLTGTRTGDKNSCGLNGSRPVRYMRKPRGPVAASLFDFRVAMELSPSRLGEGWPEQLEKVSLRVLDQEKQNT